MNNTVNFMPSFPPQMTPSIPMSTSDAIAARRTKVFLPDAQTNFSFEGNDRMTFTMNSNNEMIDGQNSWIEFDLFLANATGADLSAAQQAQKIIDVGGAHALFRRLQISLSNGTQIEDITGYNKLYSIIRLNTMSENHVRYVEAPLTGDGFISDVYDVSHYDDSVWRDITFDAATTFTNATGVLAAMAGNARSELRVGDVLRLSGNIGGVAVANLFSITGIVTAITDNNSITIAGYTSLGGNLAGNADNRFTSIKVARRNSQFTTRYRTGSTANIKLKMKPFSNFFQNSKFVPLMFLKNLQFTFELERGALAFRLLAPPGAGAGLTYEIRNPRFICSMVTPSEEVLQGMLSAYNSAEGIYYPFLSFQHNLKFVTAAASGSVTIPSNCRSAKAFIAAQYLSLSEAVEAASYINDTISTTVKNSMANFQLKIGSENYPYSRPVDTEDIYNGELLAHLQKALAVHGNIISDNSMIPSDYYAVNTVNGVAGESRRFVMGVPLARDMNSSATGIDLINNDIQFEYNRSPAPAPAPVDIYLRSWVIFDSALQISRASSIVFK